MAARGGRPTAAGSAARTERILAAATVRLLRDGFAALSLEAVAAECGVSKRTLYARFPGREALTLAIVRRLVAGWQPGFGALLTGRLPAALEAAARRILAVATTPEAMALRRLLVAEGARFPALAEAAQGGGARTGIEALADLLLAHRPGLGPAQAGFLAEQFQHLVVAGPLARAMTGAGPALTDAEAARWCRDSVALFLNGVLNGAPHGPD